MAPRGLKKALKDTAPCKLVGSGVFKHFEVKPAGTNRGIKLKGLTKRLQSHIFSDGDLPMIAKHSAAPAGGHWRGPGGGRKRGSAVDSQVSRLAGVSAEKRCASKMLNLTRMVFAALSTRGLEPLMGQRAVCSQLHRVGTAADIVCHDTENHAVVVVELKCGHSGARTAAAVRSGKPLNMKGPLGKAADSTLHRHLAQLAVTHHLLTREKDTIKKLSNMGIESVGGVLMYANDSGVDVYTLDNWWISKAPKILEKIR
tara:strand:+ start:4599 stop:5369 length:771 start_codon:yes stop_codon:yes gene_type:complete